MGGVRQALFRYQDEPYADFQARIIPTLPRSAFIGVRTPQLRKMARELARQDSADAFLRDLPHRYFEENQLHAFLISDMRDYGAALAETERFLPFMDNWATCDQMTPRAFKGREDELLPRVRAWLASGRTYTVRFGMGMLMKLYLDAKFDPACLALVGNARSEEYYVRMMAAWYFATALAKQYEAALPWIEEGRLDEWTHNKAIQKAVESDRIPPDVKAYLRGLKR